MNRQKIATSLAAGAALVFGAAVLPCSAAGAADPVIKFRVMHRFMQGSAPLPLPNLPLAVEKAGFGVSKENLQCGGVTDEKGEIFCLLAPKCKDFPALPVTFHLTFDRQDRDSLEGPWSQQVKVMRCAIQTASPVEVEFKYQSTVRIEKGIGILQQTLDPDVSAFIVNYKMANMQASSDQVGMAWLGKIKGASPTERTKVNKSLVTFVEGARNISHLYLDIAKAAPDSSLSAEAERRAAQWSAYAVAGTNVGLKVIAAGDKFANPLVKDVVVSGQVSDVRKNAAKILEFYKYTDGPRAAEITKSAEFVAKAKTFGNDEYVAWKGALGVKGASGKQF